MTLAEGIAEITPLKPDLLGVFHSRMDATAAALQVMRDQWSGPMAAYPDAGREDYLETWLQSLVNAGGLDVFACQCEEVTRAELIGLQPPRYLEWGSEQMSRRSLRTQVKDGPVDPDQVKRLTRAGMATARAGVAASKCPCCLPGSPAPTYPKCPRCLTGRLYGRCR